MHSSHPFTDPQKCPFGPFNSFTQKRIISDSQKKKKKKLITRLKKLKTILNLHQLMSNWKRGPFVSLQLMSRCKNPVGLKYQHRQTFINKYPHSLRWVWLVVTDERGWEREKRWRWDFQILVSTCFGFNLGFSFKKKKKKWHCRWCDMKNNF